MRAMSVIPGRPDSAELSEVPEPEPKDGELLVEPLYLGVCGTDREIVEGAHGEPPPGSERLVLGHELLGRVRDGGGGLEAGQLVAGIVRRPDPVPCACCARGEWDMCRNGEYTERGIKGLDGYGAELVTIEHDFAVAIPDELGTLGVLTEPASILAKAWEQIDRIATRACSVHERVLVTGAGPIGQLAVQVARALGATELTVTDVNPHRLEVASEGGASRTIDISGMPLEEAGVEADVLLECSGHPDAVREGIRALRPAGRAVMVGMGPTEEMEIPMAVVQNRELWLTGTFRYANTYPAAIALAAAGRVNLSAIITGRFALEDTEAALRAGREDPASIKPLVVPGALVSADS
jgi:2-desacetyl-2-hydroxyethyl bacteriochlorophyllide A dehydrogenase